MRRGSWTLVNFLLGLLSVVTVYAGVQPCILLPKLTLTGGTMDETTVPTVKDCCMACSNITCCIAYTYDKNTNRCYLKSSIGSSNEDSDRITGLRPNSNFGKGLGLPNIGMTGEQHHRINLQTVNECKAYCTAYKIYTWSPPHENEDGEIELGVCNCLVRIKSIQYVYGCYSEIKLTELF